jgi:hypothetical protein
MKKQEQLQNSRRRLLKVLAGAGAVAVTGTALPEKWSRPVVDAIVIPAHAQSTIIRSDRRLKRGVEPVDPREVLAQLVALPVSAWSYFFEPGTRHIGPMAQDFSAAFGVGSDNRRIDLVDANGVVIAALQALHGMVAERDAHIEALEARLSALEGVRH